MFRNLVARSSPRRKSSQVSVNSGHLGNKCSRVSRSDQNVGPMLRPRDIAHELGISLRRAYALLQCGAIPSTAVGGSIRIPRAAWERWLADHAEQALARVRTS